MQQLSRLACCCSYLFTYFVTVPHSVLTQLAWPLSNAKQGDRPLLAWPLARKHRFFENISLQKEMQEAVICGTWEITLDPGLA